MIGFESASLCFPLCQVLIDDWELVTEEEIEKALYTLVENKRIFVEGWYLFYIVWGAAALVYAGCLKYLDKLVRWLYLSLSKNAQKSILIQN